MYRSAKAVAMATVLAASALAGPIALWRWVQTAPPWLTQAIRSPLSIRCGVILLGCTAGLIVVLAMMAKLARPRRLKLAADERGVAMLEFVLLFPIATAIVLIMIQAAMLTSGNLVVHYAAYCAARSAITWIPRDVGSEPINVVRSSGASGKMQDIRQAAVLALMPIAGPAEDAGGGESARSIAAAAFDEFRDDTFPDTWDRQLARRYAWANDAENTIVELSQPTWEPVWEENSSGEPTSESLRDDAQDGWREYKIFDNGFPDLTYGPREAVRVTVRHRFLLTTPYANAIFGDPVAGRPGLYATEISVGYTLTNQGRYDDVVLEPTDGTRDPDRVLLPH